MNRLAVHVWSDIACPWCYVGKRRLEAALARFEHRDKVDVVWRAFELDPSAPRERDRSVSSAARIAAKYGMPIAQAEAAIARMVSVARTDGLDFRFDLMRSGNTFDAHRVIHAAKEHKDKGFQDAMKERFLRAYMTEGEPIGDPEVLVRLAGEVGLASEDVRAMLASDAHAAAVRADEAMARELGIQGVPFFVLDQGLGVSGAQPAETLLAALQKAWKDASSRLDAFAEGATCGPDGC